MFSLEYTNKYIKGLSDEEKNIIFDNYKTEILKRSNSSNEGAFFYICFVVLLSFFISFITMFMCTEMPKIFRMAFVIPILVLSITNSVWWFKAKKNKFYYLKYNLLSIILNKLNAMFLIISSIMLLLYYIKPELVNEKYIAVVISFYMLVSLCIAISIPKVSKRFINHLLSKTSIVNNLLQCIKVLSTVSIAIWIWFHPLVLTLTLLIILLTMLTFITIYEIYFYLNYNFIKELS